MQREELTSFKNKKILYNEETSQIYRLNDGRLLKLASPDFLDACRTLGTSYELKITNGLARKIPEIVSPITAVYHKDFCLGYTMEEIPGQNLTLYDKELSLSARADLDNYFALYSKIENIVKKANETGIILPDLCTTENIYLLPNGEIRFIDYDGMQFGPDDKTIVMSTVLGDIIKYIKSLKFHDGTCHFNSELDKTSLTILLFLIVFNVDLTKVGKYDPYTKTKVTIKDVFNMLGINDEIFMNKVAANISLNKKGTYLADELYKIIQNYNMYAFPYGEEVYIKKLIRKKN